MALRGDRAASAHGAAVSVRLHMESVPLGRWWWLQVGRDGIGVETVRAWRNWHLPPHGDHANAMRMQRGGSRAATVVASTNDRQ